MKNFSVLFVPATLLALSGCDGASSLGDGDQAGDQGSSTSSSPSSSAGASAGGQGQGGSGSPSSSASGTGGQGVGGSGGTTSVTSSSSTGGTGAAACDSAQALATNLSGPVDLDITANEIVFLTQGLDFADPTVLDAAVQKVGKDGGAVTVLSSGVSSTSYLALTSTDVLFTGFGDYPDFGDGYLAKVPIAGGATTVLAPNETQGYVVAHDGVTAFWSRLNGAGPATGDLMSTPISGGASTILATQVDPYGLWIDGSNIYYTANMLGEVRKVPKGGGASTLLATGVNWPATIVGDATTLYFAEFAGGNIGSIRRLPKAGGNAEVIAANQAGPTDLLLDGTVLYWANLGSDNQADGEIMKLDLNGGVPVVVACGQDHPTALAVDATHVYWANYGTVMVADGTIMKMPK